MTEQQKQVLVQAMTVLRQLSHQPGYRLVRYQLRRMATQLELLVNRQE